MQRALILSGTYGDAATRALIKRNGGGGGGHDYNGDKWSDIVSGEEKNILYVTD